MILFMNCYKFPRSKTFNDIMTLRCRLLFFNLSESEVHFSPMHKTTLAGGIFVSPQKCKNLGFEFAPKYEYILALKLRFSVCVTTFTVYKLMNPNGKGSFFYDIQT